MLDQTRLLLDKRGLLESSPASVRVTTAVAAAAAAAAEQSTPHRDNHGADCHANPRMMSANVFDQGKRGDGLQADGHSGHNADKHG